MDTNVKYGVFFKGTSIMEAWGYDSYDDAEYELYNALGYNYFVEQAGMSAYEFDSIHDTPVMTELIECMFEIKRYDGDAKMY